MKRLKLLILQCNALSEKRTKWKYNSLLKQNKTRQTRDQNQGRRKIVQSKFSEKATSDSITFHCKLVTTKQEEKYQTIYNKHYGQIQRKKRRKHISSVALHASLIMKSFHILMKSCHLVTDNKLINSSIIVTFNVD